ncbi:MAG TPA: aspartyl protease family protein, partial [Vicinamibacterales bacterium]
MKDAPILKDSTARTLATTAAVSSKVGAMRVVFLGLAFLSVGSASASELPRASCGGWSAIGSLSEIGRSEAGSLTGAFRDRIDTRDGRHAAARDYGVFALSEGFDGRAWSQDRSGAAHALDAPPARAIAITEAWLRRRGWCMHDDAQIEPLPMEKADGIDLAVWRVTPRGGTPAILRFARDGGLLRQSEIWTWGARLVRHYDDWRLAGGVRMPFVERDEYPEDEDVETITLTSAVASARPPAASVFAQPARPRDFAIDGGAASTTVPYEDDGVGRIFVPVSVDGKGPFVFELDTGGHLILTKETAAALQLTAAGSFNGTGGGTGIVVQGITRTREIRIGAAVLRDQPAKVVPLSGN